MTLSHRTGLDPAFLLESKVKNASFLRRKGLNRGGPSGTPDLGSQAAGKAPEGRGATGPIVVNIEKNRGAIRYLSVRKESHQ
jgi:hypothetical protein